CKKLLREADILWGRLPFGDLAAALIQPFDLIREKVFLVDPIAKQARLMVLFFVETDFKQAEIKRGGFHSVQLFRIDRFEQRLRLERPPVEQERQAMVNFGGYGLGKPADQLQR